MNATKLKVDDAILESNKIICRQISRIGESSRSEVSQEVLESLRHFVEHILLKVYAEGDDIEDTQDNIKESIKQAKNNPKLKHLSKFHRLINISISHRAIKEQNAERLMLKFYEYLIRIRTFLNDEYALSTLDNLEMFPLEIDQSMVEYYEKIANKIELSNTPIEHEFYYDRFYVQRVKPFFVDGKIYYEVAFIPANDFSSKTDRFIAFTNIEITNYYAVKFAITNDNINVLGKNLPIRIIVDWEVNIRPCELRNFTELFTLNSKNYGLVEQRELSKFLTETGLSLSDIIMFSDKAFNEVRELIVPKTDTVHFFDYIEKSRSLIKANAAGSNVLRYLLHNMTNRIIKAQHKITYTQFGEIRGCHHLSGLYLNYGCIPFDQMPFCTGLKNHVPSLSDLFDCIDSTNREYEILAWIIKNNTEQLGVLFTPLEKIDEGKYKFQNFVDVANLVDNFNIKLHDTAPQQQRKMVIKYDHLFIESYKDDTVSIIKTIKNLTINGIDNYKNWSENWMTKTDHKIDCDEKKNALIEMFDNSKVALIYGSAGTGKSTLINHISHLFSSSSKLYLAQTNSAVNNMKRKVTVSGNSSFMTVSKFINKYYRDKNDFDVVIIDECSTVSNRDMRQILSLANFELLVLVGDTFQIEAIEFGNWFDAVRGFLPSKSIFELTKPYRTENVSLLRFWNDVRKMEDDIFELMQTFSYTSNLDTTVFYPAAKNEIVLCHSYGGLYGINNFNHFLQENNSGKVIWRDVHRYKVGDPVLFNEFADKFFAPISGQTPIIHNNMKGRIIDFEIQNLGKIEECIQFDLEIDRPLIDMECRNMDFSIIGNSTNGNSIIRFLVNKNKSTDDDDDSVSKATIPFQVAYAISIHKAQGLEYDSVKLVVTEETDELIDHSIFYTAITRTRDKLKVYWTQPVERKVLERIKPKNNNEDISLLKLEMED